MSSSETSSIATISRAGALFRKSSIEVRIHRHYRSKVYTTGSTISGEAIITPQRDTPFDQIHIVFVGTTRTRLEALQVPQRSSHTFLRLSMPIPESAYPLPRVFEAGQTYSIPFHFVVPSYLTINACNHAAQSEYIHDYHMRMPPTMGFWEKDDLAPETATVEYSIKARVLRHPGEVTEQRPLKLFEAQQLINVLPASLEDPPLSITSNDRNYTLTKTKSIRKKLLGAKLGYFTATADQPAAVQLSSDGHSANGTAANLYLTFQPTSSENAPPKVTSVSAKLSSVTYYSASPMSKLPNLGGRNELSIAPRLAYSTSVPLFSTDVEKVTWKHHNGPQVRRDSGYSSDHGENDASGRRGSTKKTCPVYHTAALHIPFKLPVTRKLFLPTFHACLVSRVYVLNLTLSVGSTSVSLALPLQVTVESDDAQLNQGLPSFDSVLAEQEGFEADEHLRPRLLQVPQSEVQQGGMLPGYDDVGLYRPVVRAGVAY